MSRCPCGKVKRSVQDVCQACHLLRAMRCPYGADLTASAPQRRTIDRDEARIARAEGQMDHPRQEG